VAFDRDRAVQYAEKYWNIPCDDGIIWLYNDRLSIAEKRRELKCPAADGWTAMFVKGHDHDNPEIAVFRRPSGAGIEEMVIQEWAGLTDCAHYLSRCLSAGGASINERGVAELVNTLQARSDTKTLCERVAKETAQKIIDTGIFKKGDMIGYFNVSPTGDFGGRVAYAHSAMYVGKLDALGIGGVTCHTVARFPPKSWVFDSWWLHDGYKYTLIHFNVDDVALDPKRADELAGWWKLDYAGRSEYHYFFKTGVARYTRTAPRSAKDPIHAPVDSAYWFADAAGNVTFIWRSSGRIDKWSFDGASKTFVAKVDGATPGKLTRLK